MVAEGTRKLKAGVPILGRGGAVLGTSRDRDLWRRRGAWAKFLANGPSKLAAQPTQTGGRFAVTLFKIVIVKVDLNIL